MTDTATIVDATAQTRDTASTSTGRDVTIPLNQLFHSPANVRKQRSDQGIAELAALIKSQGLLQRLSVTAVGDGRFAVDAGGRRLAACLSLAAEGYFAEHQGIDCRLYESERAVAISMAENSGRLNMHPADEFEAFARLIAEGRTERQVADQFGVSVLTVQRRMKLANLAPRFIQLFRDGQADMDQLKVLCLVDDHALQIAAWDSLHEYNRSAYMLRQLHARDERAAGGCGDGEAGLDCNARGCSGTPGQACVGRSQDAVSAWTGRSPAERSGRTCLRQRRRFAVAVCAVGERLGADV